jgi:hypothetical protein
MTFMSVKKKIIYNLSQTKNGLPDYKSPYFDSTFSAQAALIRWRRVICTCPGVQISAYEYLYQKSVHVVPVHTAVATH